MTLAVLQTDESSGFEQDVRDLFSGRRAGHLSKWLYSTAQFPGDKATGAEAWKRCVEQAKNGSDYYVFLKERSVVKASVPLLKNVFLRNTRLVDLGPGSEDAVQHKVMPFIHAYAPEQYIGVDVCADTLNMAGREVASSSREPIAVGALEKDFIQDRFQYGTQVPREVAAIFGLTLCNMPIDPRTPELPAQLLSSHFCRLKSHFNAAESWLMVTQDTNQDPASLARAYKALSDHFTRVLYRIQRDLPVASGFEPEAFGLEVDFFRHTQACALCFVPKKDMAFTIADESFALRRGQRLYFHNAFKFDEPTFTSCARAAGFDVVESVREKDNPCVLHVLKARL